MGRVWKATALPYQSLESYCLTLAECGKLMPYLIRVWKATALPYQSLESYCLTLSEFGKLIPYLGRVWIESR